MIPSQYSIRNRLRRQHVIFVLILLLLLATIIWILSIGNIPQSPWPPVMNALFTCIGVILALLQWHAQTGENVSTLPIPHFPLRSQLQQQPLCRGKGNKGNGIRLVSTNRRWRGTMLYLVQSWQATGEGPAETIAHKTTGPVPFLCCFPEVLPGHYTLIASSKRRAWVIVYASEIDWG